MQAQKLAAENEKLQYRIIHLVRALKEADLKLEQVSVSDFPVNSFNIFIDSSVKACVLSINGVIVSEREI